MTGTAFASPADVTAETARWLRQRGFTEDRSGWFIWRGKRRNGKGEGMPAEVRVTLNGGTRLRVSGFAPEHGRQPAECWTFSFEGAPFRFLRAVLEEAGARR
jgi:hypothetical protein